MNTGIFQAISDLDGFKVAVGDKDEIRHMEQGGTYTGYTVSSYIVSAESTFDSPAARECRGVVFNAKNKIVARPLHKFFNLNERDGARPEDFDWSKLMRVMDKRDGSMIHTVKTEFDVAFDGYGFDVKSKKSFQSDVANQARDWMAQRENFLNFCEEVVSCDATAIFEWTSPTARIVLPYAEEALTLLHVRDNGTGEYWDPGHLMVVAAHYGIPVVDHDLSGADDLFEQMLSGDRNSKQVWAAVQRLAETVENIEGWVFQFKNGEMVKVKTKWYMERHRAMTFLRERDIVGMVLSESIDDLKAMLAGEKVDITEIRQIEERVINAIRQIESCIDDAMKTVEEFNMDKKAAALNFGPKGMGHPYFGLIMKKMDGHEPDVKGWYERNVLPTVSLRQLNLLQSVAEAE